LRYPSVVSWFQASKLWLLETVPISRDVAHALIGLLFLLVVVCRRPFPTWSCIIPTVVVALAGECLDIRDAFQYEKPLRLADAVKDMALTVGPALVVLGVLIRRFGRERACQHQAVRQRP
jgi:hypothetical protein